MSGLDEWSHPRWKKVIEGLTWAGSYTKEMGWVGTRIQLTQAGVTTQPSAAWGYMTNSIPHSQHIECIELIYGGGGEPDP